MGTNYYAEWTPKQARGVTINLHICKSLVGFNGEVFPDWSSWKTFLTHGAANETVIIRDEYGGAHEADQFVRDVEATTPENRMRQVRWLIAHGYPLERDWLDSEGFSFHNGEFS